MALEPTQSPEPSDDVDALVESTKARDLAEATNKVVAAEAAKLPTAAELYTRSLEEEVVRLKDQKESLIQEFTDASSEEKVTLARDEFAAALPNAIKQIVHLAQHGKSETIRSSNSKFIVDFVQRNSEEGDNPLKELLESLKTNGNNTPVG